MVSHSDYQVILEPEEGVPLSLGETEFALLAVPARKYIKNGRGEFSRGCTRKRRRLKPGVYERLAFDCPER
jgi:hypothetical protein